MTPLTRGQFANTVCGELTSRATAAPVGIAALCAWMIAESGSEPCDGHSGADHNPLNTTLELPGVTPYNTFGDGLHVWNYLTIADGIAATLATLRQANMAGIATAIHDDRSLGYILGQIASSPWGTGSLVWSGLSLYQKDPSGYQRLLIGEVGSAPPTSREPLPPSAWKWALWRLNAGAYKHRGYPNPATRPDVPQRIPVAWWRAVSWLHRHHVV